MVQDDRRGADTGQLSLEFVKLLTNKHYYKEKKAFHINCNANLFHEDGHSEPH